MGNLFMFEFSIALKYLLPRWRQLSVSIISLISILVIALVVWLIVVFFSVKNGLEKSWIDKLIALTAPIRLTPNEDYYKSYYYQIDTISAQSDYQPKSIREKRDTSLTDPYNNLIDEEHPSQWAEADLDDAGNLKDIVKLAFASILNTRAVDDLTAMDFEIAATTLQLKFIRENSPNTPLNAPMQMQSQLTQPIYLGSIDADNPRLVQGLLPIHEEDLDNILRMLAIATTQEGEEIATITYATPKLVQERMKTLFDEVEIQKLKAPPYGWKIPSHLLQGYANLNAAVLMRGDRLSGVVLPDNKHKLEDLVNQLEKKGFRVQSGTVALRPGQQPIVKLQGDDKPYPLLGYMPILVEGGTEFDAILLEDSFSSAKAGNELKFEITLPIQGQKLTGVVPLGSLEVAQFNCKKASSVFLCKGAEQIALRSLPEMGEGILLPRSFREAGAKIGDKGRFAYQAPTTTAIQEQSIPFYVAGFYDPGIMPVGGKFALANHELVSVIRSAQQQDQMTRATNGINVRFTDLDQVDQVKREIVKNLETAGIARYWNVETYKEYEYIRDVIKQLHSEKNIFSLISGVIIIVACSNIISMLIILVNDKRMEIGILRSMGASSKSIAAIFGLCGVVMGCMGSLLGIGMALLTLQNINMLVGILSRFQGYEMFNPLFFGDTLPTEISGETLIFVVAVTACISTLAGLVPAFKACTIRPSHILRSE